MMDPEKEDPNSSVTGKLMQVRVTQWELKGNHREANAGKGNPMGTKGKP